MSDRQTLQDKIYFRLFVTVIDISCGKTFWRFDDLAEIVLPGSWRLAPKLWGCCPCGRARGRACKKNESSKISYITRGPTAHQGMRFVRENKLGHTGCILKNYLSLTWMKCTVHLRCGLSSRWCKVEVSVLVVGASGSVRVVKNILYFLDQRSQSLLVVEAVRLHLQDA